MKGGGGERRAGTEQRAGVDWTPLARLPDPGPAARPEWHGTPRRPPPGSGTPPRVSGGGGGGADQADHAALTKPVFGHVVQNVMSARYFGFRPVSPGRECSAKSGSEPLGWSQERSYRKSAKITKLSTGGSGGSMSLTLYFGCLRKRLTLKKH